ncbi:Rubrerythrin [Malonomonas rubra DSM 5091]|uniref:Rubrerythrin n=1 Tax=Malonomonas rubra DSM 5091 TaxID=1122189 RepID=A0A1M6GKY4_MALRU|nr:ferritin family protein [Malonomonas rubra]SHJ10584.1 Rubrerythrin [Malonomonas rubra DSM 5091]
MLSEIDVKNALLRSVQTEKNAMNFYQIAAKQMKNADAIKTFELLAKEEREHAKHFFDKCDCAAELGDFETFIAQDPDKNDEWLSDLDKALLANFNDQKAMELAMEKEKRLEESLREMAAKIEDPEVRAVFEENAKSTNHHWQLIESEYARIMGMPHETDIDTFVRE